MTAPHLADAQPRIPCCGQTAETHMDLLRHIDRNAERWLLLIFYVMLVITMAIEVLRREIFSYSSIWGEEIVRYSFIYLAWIGAAAAVKERAHIRIDVVMHYLNLGPRAQGSHADISPAQLFRDHAHRCL